MAAGWYVLQTYTGYENKIEKTLRLMIGRGELDGAIVRDVRVPTEEVAEVKDGKKRSRQVKFLPGYILVEMDLPDNWKPTTSRIRAMDGVVGFVGTAADRRPNHLTAEEARGLLMKSGDNKGERPARARQSFAPGEQVKIIDGPFESFTGAIDEVIIEKNKLKVMVPIFGRNTSVEVDILQVEKV